MKILYMNGYKGSTNKARILEKIIKKPVDANLIDYDNFDYEKVEENAKNYDLIIGSSTGAYVARNICEKYNIPLISINPVIDINKTFDKLGVKAPKIPKPEFLNLEELVLLGSNDTLINYKDTKKKLKNKAKIVIKESDHRFGNLINTKKEILDFIKFLYIS